MNAFPESISRTGPIANASIESLVSENPILETTLRAVVTGASSGIGRQIAVSLAKLSVATNASPQLTATTSNARIVIHYRKNREGADETAELVRQEGAEAEIVQADLCDSNDRARLVQRSWELLERPNTWVNNAGADVLTGNNANLSFSEKLRLLFETDVFGTIALSQDVIRRMKNDLEIASENSSPPSMTFIGWDQAALGMEGDAGQMFGPVKAAVMAFANSLAQDVSPKIRVNTICPGWIQTAWGQTTSQTWDRRAKNQALMHRWGTPKDVAKAVAFVADPENSFCTGQTINVNGGWNRRYG